MVRASASADSATRALRLLGGAGRGGAGMSEVILDLPPHAFDLLAERLGDFELSRALGGIRFLRQHREWRLEPVREVAGLGERTAHARFAVLEQRVQILDQRLNFRGIVAGDPRLATTANVGEPRSELMERRETEPHLPERRRQHADSGEAEQAVVEHPHRQRRAVEQIDRDVVHHQDDSDRPQDRADDDPESQRRTLHAEAIR
jgi:hypothetical protein